MNHDVYTRIHSIDTLTFNPDTITPDAITPDANWPASDRVAVIYTGGTIGMQATEKGLAPASDMARRLATPLFSLPDSRKHCLPDFDLLTLNELIDSSNASPQSWYQLAELIWQLRDHYRGFVLLHGTDTLAYTSSALSYLTAGSGKPVIVTGSQYPLESENSDAPGNVEAALRLAREEQIQQTLVAFGGRILRGNRCTKVSTYSPQGFDSPNADWVGEWSDAQFTLDKNKLSAPLSLDENLSDALHNACLDASPQVSIIKFYPGIRAEMLQPLLSHPVQAAILESYGSGNAPDQNTALLDLLRQASASGIVLVNRSQCPEGAVSMSYAAGSALAEAGVISGHDMTGEAAYSKLHCLLASGLTGDDLKQAFAHNYCGEISV